MNEPKRPASDAEWYCRKDPEAERAASAVNRRLLQRDIPGGGETAVTGYDFGQWASAAKRLLEHGHYRARRQPVFLRAWRLRSWAWINHKRQAA